MSCINIESTDLVSALNLLLSELCAHRHLDVLQSLHYLVILGAAAEILTQNLQRTLTVLLRFLQIVAIVCQFARLGQPPPYKRVPAILPIVRHNYLDNSTTLYQLLQSLQCLNELPSLQLRQILLCQHLICAPLRLLQLLLFRLLPAFVQAALAFTLKVVVLLQELPPFSVVLEHRVADREFLQISVVVVQEDILAPPAVKMVAISHRLVFPASRAPVVEEVRGRVEPQTDGVPELVRHCEAVELNLNLQSDQRSYVLELLV